MLEWNSLLSPSLALSHFSSRGKLLDLYNLQFSFLQNADNKLSCGLNERPCVKDLERHWTQSKNHDNLLFVAIRILIYLCILT